MEGSRRRYALGILIAGSVVISFAGVLVRLIEGADPWQINFYRALSQFTFVLVVLVFQYRGAVLNSVLRIGWPGLWAGIALAGASISYMESITSTTVANTLFILSAIPLMTALLARIFLGELLNRETIIAMAVAMGGVAVMLGEGFGAGSLYGNVMALLTAAGFSTFAVIVRKHRELDMLPTLLVAAVLITISALVVKQGDMVVSQRDLIICLIWGAVLVGLANWTFIIASRYLLAAEVTFFMLLEFAVGPLWVWLIIGETASAWTMVGGSMVIGAVAMRTVIQLRQARRSRVPIATP